MPKADKYYNLLSTAFGQVAINTSIRLQQQNGYAPLIKYRHLQFINMATYSSWVTIFWSIFDACCTSEHPFYSRFKAGRPVCYTCLRGIHIFLR